MFLLYVVIRYRKHFAAAFLFALISLGLSDFLSEVKESRVSTQVVKDKHRVKSDQHTDKPNH